MKKKFFRVYRFKKILSILMVLLFALILLMRPQAAISSCSQALMRCGQILIPSLFPFFVCAALLVELGFAEYMTRFLTPLMKPIFNVPGSGALALLLGVLSGYPVGASTVADLREKKLCSKTEGERMLAFCTNSGPLFILGSIGIGVFGQQRLGILLYLSHIIAALLVGIVFRFYHASNPPEPTLVKSMNPCPKSFSEIVTSSIRKSCINMFYVCGFVVIFNVFVDLLVVAPFGSHMGSAPSFLAGLMEVTIGSVMTGSLPFLSLTQKLMMVSFLIGFGGMCVHFQVISILSNTDLSIKPYLGGKLLCGIFSVGIFIILLRFFPIPMDVFFTLSPDLNFSAVSFENTIKLTFFYIGIAAIAMVILYFVTLIISKREK